MSQVSKKIKQVQGMQNTFENNALQCILMRASSRVWPPVPCTSCERASFCHRGFLLSSVHARSSMKASSCDWLPVPCTSCRRGHPFTVGLPVLSCSRVLAFGMHAGLQLWLASCAVYNSSEWPPVVAGFHLRASHTPECFEFHAGLRL